MTWHYRTLGTHTHVRVFSSGALCGTLVFRYEEFRHLSLSLYGLVVFIDDLAEEKQDAN